MNPVSRCLTTRHGAIPFPAYFPVTTFGEKYPLDRLVRPYLCRLAPGVMVSYHYAKQMGEPLGVPLLVDSGGFAALLEGSQVVADGRLGVLEVNREGQRQRVHPRDVIELQEQVADVAFSLDFPIPPGLDTAGARQRQKWTIANAHWALANRRRKDLPLFACVQGWDRKSARECARAYAGCGFDGIAVGGLVPRARQVARVCGIIGAVRRAIGDLPLHVFGLGKPALVAAVLDAGADSVDSSAYVQLAADGRSWFTGQAVLDDPSPFDRLRLALCNLACATGRGLPLPMIEAAIAAQRSMGEGSRTLNG